jgi:hypothetical protein
VGLYTTQIHDNKSAQISFQDADQKLLQQTYNRFIFIPRPDYGSLSFAWRELLA